MQQRMGQVQILAPRMIQSMEILQLPIMALQERIQQELQENPVLELAESDPTPLDDLEPSANGDDDFDPVSQELVIDDRGDAEVDFDRLEALNRDWENHFNEEHRPSRNGQDEESDKKHDAMQNMASRPQSLQDYLADQLAFLDLDPEHLALVKYLITHIDDNGYLTVPLADAAQTYGQNFGRPVSVEDLEDALHLVQKLDPPGVGARNLAECLLLQLTPETPHRDVLRVLIQNHLDDIWHNRLPNIQKRTGFDLHAIKEAIEQLRHLNPKPGAQFSGSNIPYVVPDILVDRTEEGDYTVRLVDDWVPNIYISPRYVDLYREKGGDPKTKEYLKRKIQAAQWLQESIEQRRNTLIKVTRAI
ncbi:MAG TPA: RNA polymerase sigma-54 factor, partial [Gemmataceae bacterium]|nr:RNA polymerase sigma-54 factor [Gemmataceae bacterium]